MPDTKLREWAREWIARRGMPTLYDVDLERAGESLVRACAEIAEAKNGLCPGMAILRAYGLSKEGRG